MSDNLIGDKIIPHTDNTDTTSVRYCTHDIWNESIYGPNNLSRPFPNAYIEISAREVLH